MLPNFSEDFEGGRVFMLSKLPGGEEEWEGTRREKTKLGNTFSWKRYFSKPLTTKPETLADIQGFLSGCTYLSDRVTRNCSDYWEPPDVFEKRKTGDCEDHAIWAWRQLHDMGYRSRLVLGDCGEGHAWVHVYVNGRVYLLEATQKHKWLPGAKSYDAHWSVERRENGRFAIYQHNYGKISYLWLNSLNVKRRWKKIRTCKKMKKEFCQFL